MYFQLPSLPAGAPLSITIKDDTTFNMPFVLIGCARDMNNDL